MGSKTNRPRGWHPRSALVRVGVTLFAAALASGALVMARQPSEPTSTPTATTAAANPTVVRVASFNVLGYSHTTAGHRTRYADGVQRTVWASQIIRNYNLQIVGLQEFQVPQYKEFVALNGSRFSIYPGVTMGGVPVQNSLIWRADRWAAVEQHTMKIPYFNGVMTPMPYVLLQNRTTGQLVWVYNSHNPADSAGNAQVYRNRAVALETQLVHRLESAYPNVPILDVGDKNDRSPYICPMMKNAQMHSASGGSSTGGVCTPPWPMYADWVTGNDLVTFANYHALRTALVQKTTDHHVLYADATLTSTPVSHVVLVDVEGLRSGLLRNTTAKLPTLRSMMAAGTSTTDARTAYETVGALPNAIGMLTARPAGRAYGGTGVTPRSTTVASAAGSYVPSAFDPVHDAGGRTGFWTSNPDLWRLVTSSWDGTHGAPDRMGADNGRDKISIGAVTATDKAAMSKLTADLRGYDTTLAVAVLSAPAHAARVYGPQSPQYLASLGAIDGYIANLIATIKATPDLAGRTTVVVTSDHGAVARHRATAANPNAYRIPVVAWGSGVTADGDLYTLNGQFIDPADRRISYAATRQPVRIGYLANLATRLLGLGALGTMDSGQTLTVGG